MAPPKKLKTPDGVTYSGKPPRPRLTKDIPGLGKRDDYLYRAKVEKRLGRKLKTNEVVDHKDESLAGKKALDPPARVESRSANSKQGGGLRHHLERARAAKKGKK